MKQIAQYQDGRLELQEVPAPQAPYGGILVKTTYSVISPGTEKMKVEQAKMNLLQKAKARPDQVKKVLESARTLGWKAAYQKVKNRLESPTPLGYSAAGIVESVHPANTRYQVGDRVAVGGAECAFHAEILAVPDKLSVKIPNGVEDWQAAYTTMISISMQGIRQANLTLGDRVMIFGQGLVGLLCTALAKAAGARVLAIDLDDARLDVAKKMGAEIVYNPKNGADIQDVVREWTNGFGADASFICTAGSNVPCDQTCDALRDRGTMVIVGITDPVLDWKRYYRKEIEVKFSRSYGPGRYDPSYEWGGNDYPIGYVRWTEERNFECALDLIRQGVINLEALTTSTVQFEDCLEVYERLMQKECADIGVILSYGKAVELKNEVMSPKIESLVAGESLKINSIEALDVFGAGNFVKTMLLPHLKNRIPLGAIVTQTALSAKHVQQKFGFKSLETDYQKTFEQKGNRAILIGTRHHMHAPMVLAGLKANRHVFVEKPLCLTREEMVEIDAAYQANEQATIMIGFNRRFAPATQLIKKKIKNIPGPKTIAYHVYCGKLDPESWYSNYEESGGRILGEACHFLDYFIYMLDSKPVRVFAQNVWKTEGRLPFPDSVTAQIEFEDGSCAQLIYTAEGNHAFAKELFTIYGAGIVARCENFQKIEIYQNGKSTTSKHNSKGHAEEMNAWSEFLNAKANHPLPYEQSRISMHLTFALLESIQQGCSVEL